MIFSGLRSLASILAGFAVIVLGTVLTFVVAAKSLFDEDPRLGRVVLSETAGL